MLNCPPSENAERSKIGHKKPIVLSSQRYERLMNNATQASKLRALKESEEEEKYRQYLKDGSDALVAQFRGNIQRTQDEKLAEFKDQMEKKMMKIKESLDQAKENEAQARRDKVAKAQQLIEQLKPGPRELHCAALQSEVLRARNVQRNINEEFERVIKKQECLDNMKCDFQNMPFITEEQKRLEERQKSNVTYKKEILQTINECSKQRADYKKQLLKEQQAEREAMDQEIKAQIEKEKAIMEKKRAALRKNALEAMKMVEQRRLRERMTDEIEERLCCVYNLGKKHIENVKTEKQQQTEAERQLAAEANAKYLQCMQQKIEAIDDERIRRDISRMQLKFTAEEQEKIRKDKAAKQARIEAYMRDMQAQKEAKRRAEEEKRFDMAQRFKNSEVNCFYEQAQKQERLRKVNEVRATLKAQEEEKKRKAKADKESEPKEMDTKKDREDQFFFEYARNLMEDAQKKERPLYPFIKVVQQYKRDRNIECDRKTPKHLVSQVGIGVRQAGDTQCKAPEAEHATKVQSPSKAAASDKERDKLKDDKLAKDSILENCLKISEIIAAETKDKKSQERRRTTDCMQPGKRLTKDPAAGTCKEPLKEDPNRVRYTMYELKRMNQFAPTPASNQ